MERVKEPINNKWKLFSPIKNNFLWMFLTGFYLFLLVQSYKIVKLIYFNPYGVSDYSFFYLISGGGYSDLILSLILVVISFIIIYKSFLRGIISYTVLLFIFFIYFYFSTGGSGETFNLGMVAFIILGVFYLPITFIVLGFTFRALLKIKSKIIISLLLIIPFIIFSIAIFLSTSQLQNLSYDQCKNSEMGQINDCFFKLALQENNYAYCFGRSSSDSEYCIDQITGGNIENLDPSECGNILKDEEKNSCYWKVADINKDSSICNNIDNDLIKSNCLNWER